MPIREQIDQIVSGLKAAQESGAAVEGTHQDALQRFGELVPQTELDRLHQLSGWLQLCDLMLAHVQGEDARVIADQRAQAAALMQRRYAGGETAYVRSRTIVENVAAQLAAGNDSATTASKAIEEVETLPFDEGDASAKTIATLAVHALRAAHDWLGGYDADPKKLEPLQFSLRMIATALELGGFNQETVLKAAQNIREARLSFDGTPVRHASALMVVFGLGLRADPTALPALEPVCVLLNEALAEIPQQDLKSESATEFSSRCEAVLEEFERGLNEQGFSEYLMRQATAGLQELPTQSAEEAGILRASLVRLIDSAVPHAPSEAAQTLLVSRESILQQDAPPGPPLDAEGLRLEGEAVLQRLRDELAAGGLPSPAVMRAIAAIQALGRRCADDDEEAGKTLVRLMPEVISISAPYAEPGKVTLAEDTATSFRESFSEAEAILDNEGARQEVAQQSAMREVRRFAQTPTADPFEQPEAPAHQRQFAALLRPFMARLAAIRSLPDAGAREAAEAERITKRADIAFNRLRAATTEAQWIEHQRGSLRRVAVDLRRFERRHHLMLIEPPWPSHNVEIDPNAVFFSGQPPAQKAVKVAGARIGMEATAPHGVDDPTVTRWDLLRRSAVAVFDFTAYDRASSDPAGMLPRSKEKREAIARAATPVARVAYECGWALVLGVPMVIIARDGQALPFDIDIEPVRLAGDEGDPMRVALGLQGALVGTQRGAQTSGFAATVERIRERLADDAQAAPLLEMLAASRDAMEVRLGVEALLERATCRGAMLALAAFPPVYPPRDGARTLFHVTAFRPWSRPCEETLREVCSQAGFEYRIGYEHLDPDILHAIWADLAGASIVVADLTNLNPNAALELGLAQALGRPTIVVTQTSDLPVHLPALAKVRIHSYRTKSSGRVELAGLLERALGDLS